MGTCSDVKELVAKTAVSFQKRLARTRSTMATQYSDCLQHALSLTQSCRAGGSSEGSVKAVYWPSIDTHGVREEVHGFLQFLNIGLVCVGGGGGYRMD